MAESRQMPASFWRLRAQRRQHLRLMSSVLVSSSTAAIVLAMGAPSAAALTTGPAALEISTVSVGGLARTFQTFIPTTRRTSHSPALGPAPMIVALSSYVHTAADLAGATSLNAAADRLGIYVVYPDAPRLRWNAGLCCALGKDPANPPLDDVAFLDAAIASAQDQYSLDPTRIYVLGLSNGAMMAHRYACERSWKVAAVVSVAGTLEVACNASRPVSILQVSGLRDANVPYLGSPYSAGLGGPLTPVPTAMGYWEAMAHCSGQPVITASPKVITRSYEGCAAGTGIKTVTMPLAGHVWPTLAKDGYDATGEAMVFMLAHRQKPVTLVAAKRSLAIQASPAGSVVTGMLKGRFDVVPGVTIEAWGRTGATWVQLSSVVSDVSGAFTVKKPVGYSALWLSARVRGLPAATASVSL